MLHILRQSIFESLELFLSNEGQVIVDTERETGIEKRASNVITLTEKRRCLTNTKYNEHIEFLQMVQKIAINWVAENHKKQKDPIIEE